MRARLFLLLLLFAAPLCAESNASGFQWAPGGRLFPVAIADPREIRTFVSFDNTRQILACVGTYFSVFSVTPEDKRWAVHFGLEGRGLFQMHQSGGRFPLETLDGTLGFYLEYKQGPWAAQLRYTHVSAHLADGSLGVPFPYSRESVILRASYSPNDYAQIYFGAHRLVNSFPPMHGLSLQVGGNYFLPVQGSVAPYVAADLRWQEESKVNPSFALQLGIALQQSGKPRDGLRMYYSYYTGADVRGQYYFATKSYHGFALELPL